MDRQRAGTNIVNAADDEIEIDLLELLFEFKKHILVIILAGLLGCIGFFVYSTYIITPQYISTSMVYVLSKETTLTSLADLQIGSQLTEDYSYLIVSRPVLGQVIEELDLDMTYSELKSKISIDNPDSTRILNITVRDVDPVRAKAIVDSVARRSSDYIGSIMEMIPPKIIEEGVVAIHQSSPNVKRNTMIGGMFMVVVACGIITLRTIMNDTIRSEDDIKKYLGVSVLAVIPRDKTIGRDNREVKTIKDGKADAEDEG